MVNIDLDTIVILGTLQKMGGACLVCAITIIVKTTTENKNHNLYSREMVFSLNMPFD